MPRKRCWADARPQPVRLQQASCQLRNAHARLGMTDHNKRPRSSMLRELEETLDRHRRAPGDDGIHASEGHSERRKFGLRYPGWRLPFNPWFMFDRRHPVVRRVTIVAGATGAVMLVVGLVLFAFGLKKINRK